MSQPYEALVILKALGTETDLAQAVSQMEEPIKRFGGRVDQSVSWGRRRLAYRIAMGVRASDQNWKRELNGLIQANQPEINKLLLS